VHAVSLTDIEPLRPLLSIQPLGLFSDIDGTLSPIVPRPEDARITPRCRELLIDLIGNDVRVALITGRTFDVARTMVGIDEAAYAGNHGLEFWVDNSLEVSTPIGPFPGIVDKALSQRSNLSQFGVTVEIKREGVAFHYRQAPDEPSAVFEIERTIGLLNAEEFQRLEGRKVIELRPNVEENKGTAARKLAFRLGLKSIICLGDDRTDVDMFDAVHALAKQGIEGRAVAVMSPEAHPEVLAAADYSVDGVGGVEWLLAELADAVTPTAG
jgi:trehalose 6-phosphate phosphatase